jgi:prepilin-type N-terminal cleavage/methylation domain-containing protein
MSRNYKENGFTLFELLLVIIIISLLSVFALPHFLNMQKEAKIASTKGKLTAIRGGLELAHARIMISGVNTGPTGDNPDWPTLEEVQNNELTLTSRPASLRNLKFVRGYGDTNDGQGDLPSCNLPDMTSTMITNKTSVASMSLGDILSNPPRGDEKSCWAYYPGDERDENGKTVEAYFYVNDDRPLTDNVDAADRRPSQW